MPPDVGIRQRKQSQKKNYETNKNQGNVFNKESKREVSRAAIKNLDDHNREPFLQYVVVTHLIFIH